MKYEDIPRTRRYLNTLGKDLNTVMEAIKDTRITAAELPQFDNVLETMEIMTGDLQTKLETLEKELITVYETFIDELQEK